MILFKIIPGREKDILDAESIILRHKDKLSREYLEKWAMSLSDMAEDIRIWNILQKLLSPLTREGD